MFGPHCLIKTLLPFWKTIYFLHKYYYSLITIEVIVFKVRNKIYRDASVIIIKVITIC